VIFGIFKKIKKAGFFFRGAEGFFNFETDDIDHVREG